MARATYVELGDACATAHAMELIGARWTYPIVRELTLGPKRFTELLADVRGITPAVLTSRLRALSEQGLVSSADEAGATRYALTPWARELAPILRHLGRWAQTSPSRIDGGGLTPDAAVQAMITLAETLPSCDAVVFALELVDGRVAGGPVRRYRVAVGGQGDGVPGHVPGHCAAIDVRPGPAQDATALVRCDSSAWAGLLWRRVGVAASGVRMSGDVGGVRAFVRAMRAAAG